MNYEVRIHPFALQNLLSAFSERDAAEDVGNFGAEAGSITRACPALLPCAVTQTAPAPRAEAAAEGQSQHQLLCHLGRGEPSNKQGGGCMVFLG